MDGSFEIENLKPFENSIILAFLMVMAALFPDTCISPEEPWSEWRLKWFPLRTANTLAA
jgi:hypothetical protein